MMYIEKLICRLQREVVTKVTSLANYITDRISCKPIKTREKDMHHIFDYILTNNIEN